MSVGTSSVLDRMVARAARLFQVPVAVVIPLQGTDDAVWASFGTPEAEIAAELVFCREMAKRHTPFINTRLCDDPEFRKHVGTPQRRPCMFAAVLPFGNPANSHAGALCLLDYAQRDTLTPQELDHLQDMALFAGSHLSHSANDPRQLPDMSHYDPVTGLPSRSRMFERIIPILDPQVGGALVMLDLDDFAIINQTHGHAFGDLILRRAGAALAENLREQDWLAYWGGDRYCMYLPGITKTNDIITTCFELAAHVQKVDRKPGQLNTSIGVAVFPKDGDSAQDIVARADFALDQARADDVQIRFFDSKSREHAQARSRYEAQLEHALENDEFEVFYQPQFRTDDKRIVGAEALIRWRHPEDGLILPGAFLPALENSPLAIPVGDWVLRTACAQVSHWRRNYNPYLTIGVNLFAMQLKMGDFEAKVHRTLATTELPVQALEIELTENIILHNHSSIIAPLERLRKSGVGIAFDDYGTGYASLSLLKSYPLSRLKVDRSFIRELETDREDRAVVRAILHLAKSFKLGVIAEGIETPEQMELLQQSGCHFGQGFYIGKPVPANEFEQRFLRGDHLQTAAQ